MNSENLADNESADSLDELLSDSSQEQLRRPTDDVDEEYASMPELQNPSSDTSDTSDTSDDSSSEASDEYGDVDEATTVQFQDLRQVHALVRNSLDEGNSNGNTRDDNVRGSREGEYSSATEHLQDILLDSSVLSNQISNRFVMESQRLRRAENINNRSSLGIRPAQSFAADLRNFARAMDAVAGVLENRAREHISSPNSSSAGHNNNRHADNSNQQNNNNPGIMDAIGNIVNNVSNVLRARQSNNGRARRSEEQRRASINLNRSTSDEALNIIRMAISQRSNVPLSRLIGCVANFESPKNDAETLLRHFSNNKIGNFIIFAPVISVVAELLNHISMSDLMKLVCVSGVKKLSKPGGGSDLNLNKIAECISSLDVTNEDCKGLVHAAAIRYDKILMDDKIDSVFPSFSRDFSPSQKWCFLIDNFYTICFPGLINWQYAELQDYKSLITESMRNILKAFIKHFHCTDNSGRLLSRQVASYVCFIQHEIVLLCVKLQQEYGVCLPLERICRLILEQFLLSMPFGENFTPLPVATAMAKAFLPLFADSFNAVRERTYGDESEVSGNASSLGTSLNGLVELGVD